MSDDDLRSELERLRSENEALKNGAAKGVSLKVSEKGDFRYTGWEDSPSHSIRSSGSSCSISLRRSVSSSKPTRAN
jgi:hypothetical protein